MRQSATSIQFAESMCTFPAFAKCFLNCSSVQQLEVLLPYPPCQYPQVSAAFTRSTVLMGLVQCRASGAPQSGGQCEGNQVEVDLAARDR